MTCSEVRVFIDRVPDAQSSRVALEDLERHEERCDRCGAELAAARRRDDALGRLANPVPPAEFLATTMSRIERLEDPEQGASAVRAGTGRATAGGAGRFAWVWALVGPLAGVALFAWLASTGVPPAAALPSMGEGMAGFAMMPGAAQVALALATVFLLYLAGLVVPVGVADARGVARRR
jgi:hypothetical protein